MFEERKNPLGFVEAHPKPSSEDLNDFYENQYYQDEHSQYTHQYSASEIQFFESDGIVTEATIKLLGKSPRSLLDAGCGEGFFSKYFLDRHWGVTCCDFSDDGLRRFHPQLLSNFIKGDAYDVLESLGKTANFDLINFSNVLEHVLDPGQALRMLRDCANEETLIRCVVPNDYSSFQDALLDAEMTRNTWFAPPQHLSYFNTENIDALFEECGLKIVSKQVTFPIELFLTNPHSNYVEHADRGKQAHHARVFCVNYLSRKSAEDYVRYCEAAAALSFGRDIVVYAAKV
ncbi:MAG: class I SAM-dependent methyltransferase [Pseudomonadota bacterium]